jgi:NAD(P)-dependent dehydrogenase (short-subunit alcohol dehydrogenase family)
MELSEKVVVITGSGSGIGRATALSFAEQGATIVVCGRRLSSLNETVQQIEQKQGIAWAIPVDVTNWVQVKNMTDTILQRFGKIDIIVNNAGIIDVKPIVQMTEKEWENIIDINLKGVFLCCKAVIPSMVTANQGIIINISSILGKNGIAYHGAYCASKFGVIGLTESLADELKENNIRVFAVCPGSTNTELHRKAVGDEIAKFAMPPQTIAETILGLSLKKSTIPSGNSIIIDESSSHISVNNFKSKIIGGLKSITHLKKIFREMNMTFRK